MTQILTAENYLTMPWANGGGVTQQVATAPTESDMNSFDWRVSVAQINQSGPFSELPGVDRVLALIDGDSLQLTISDVVHHLTPDTPIRFAGESYVDCHLSEGPTRDLNLMTRRGQCSGTMQFITDSGIGIEPHDLDSTVVVITRGSFEFDGTSLSVADALILDRPITLAGRGTVAVLRITPTTSSTNNLVTEGRSSAHTSKVVD